MKKFILILISGLLTFGLGVSGVGAANRGGELNGSEIGGRKIVSAAKAVKEVMDVYDKFLIAGGDNEYQDGEDRILRTIVTKQDKRAVLEIVEPETTWKGWDLDGKGTDNVVEEIKLTVKKDKKGLNAVNVKKASVAGEPVEEIELAVEEIIRARVTGEPGDNIGVCIRGISKDELKSLVGAAGGVKEVMNVEDRAYAVGLDNDEQWERKRPTRRTYAVGLNGSDIFLRSLISDGDGIILDGLRSLIDKSGSVILIGDDGQYTAGPKPVREVMDVYDKMDI